MNARTFRLIGRLNAAVVAPLLALLFIGFGSLLAPQRVSAQAADACFATHNNGTTVFSSVNAHAVQLAVDAASPGGTVKVAGECVGVELVALTLQSTYISKTLTLSGGYTNTLASWAGAGDPILHPTTIDANNNGRVIYATAALTVSNITLQRGQISGDGGGVLAGNSLSLSNVQVLSNTASSSGGGAFANGEVTAVNSRFENNRSTISQGGGLYAFSTLWLTNTHFISNTALYDGGGVFAVGAVTAVNSRFENNRSTISRGGGLHAQSTLWLTNTHFISNTAQLDGGGVFAVGAVTAVNSRFENNRSTSGLGGGLYAGSTLLLTNSRFLSNTTFYDGGGVFAADTVTAVSSRFENNRTGAAGGGGLYSRSTLWLTNTHFLSNTAATTGGGIVLLGDGAASERLVNVLMAGNRASTAGNAIYANHISGDDTLTILHTTIASPTLTSGAAVVVADGTAWISNTIIVSHTTGISQTGGTVTQNYNLFYGNTNNISGTVGGGANSVVGDPAFVNPAADDYRLTAASAAINIGANVGVYTDFEGQVRPQGGGFDAGYDESPFTPTGSIVVKKVAVGGDGSFGFSSSFTTTRPFTLTTVGGVISKTFANLTPGSSYTLTENAPAGWVLTGASCDQGTLPNGVSVTAGMTTTCTFTNTVGLCHATHNNGTTVFSSVDAHAVQQAVDAATPGGTVKVAGTCVGVESRASTNQSTYISKTLTLSGGYTNTLPSWTGAGDPLINPTVIDANSGGRVIFATNVPLTVQNITLQRGVISGSGTVCPDAGCGGGVWAQGALSLSNVQVLSNTANSIGGGAIIFGAVTAANSRFENNRSTDSYGGGLAAVSTLWLTNTHFISNTASGDGGGAIAVGAVTAANSRFENNRSTGSQGGGLYAVSTLWLTNTHFISNTAQFDGGGAIVLGAATAADSRFENNRSTGSAGGGLWADSTVWLTNTHFISNTASSFGGGAYASGAVTAANSRFENNRSMNNRGGGLFADSTLGLTNTHFISNTAWQEGGGARANGAVTAVNSRFENNNSTGDFGGGGGLYAVSTMWLTNTHFISNTAKFEGGGAYARGAARAVNSRFENNRSTGDFGGGGGLSSANSTLWLTNTHFVSNTASGPGGGAYAYRAVTAVNSRFENNRSTGDFGGGLSALSTLLLTNTHFISNTAFNLGGGALAFGAATAVNSRFENNRSTDSQGGGLYTFSSLWLTNTHFLSNTAQTEGGGASAGDAVTAVNSRFENNNSTDSSGGGLFADSTVSLTNTHFLSNTAQTDGGGAAAYLAVTVVNSRFENNHSRAATGGGLYLYGIGATSGRLVNVLLAGNRAGGAGQAIYAAHDGGDDTLTILHTTIATPTLTGGAAVVVAAGTAWISNTIIVNHATGIQNSGGAVTQNYNLFYGNTANTAGTVGGGANSVVGNPAFVNPAADDYRLTATSAAINIGANVGVYTDFEGDVRPGGGGFDAGYDETAFTSDVGIAKTATPTSTSPGGVVVYRLSFSNTGTGLVSNVVISDSIPVSVTVTGVTSITNGAGIVITQTSPAPNLRWLVNKLAVSEGGVITITGVVSTNNALIDTSFTNTALIRVTADFTPTNNSGSAPLNVIGLPGTIIVQKVVMGTPPASAWQFVGPTGAFTLPAVGGRAVFTPVAVGPYTISETPQAGYTASSACSNGASGAASVNVTLGSAQTITCTFTNTRQFVDIVVVKQSVPQSSTNFRFTGSYLGGGSGSDSGASIADFYLDDAAPDDGDAYGSSKSFTVPRGAIYSFAEPAVSGWYLAFITCTPAGSATVTLATRSVTINTSSGYDVTCTFRNEKAAALTVRKYRETNGMPGQQAPEAFLSTWTIQVKMPSPTNTLVSQAATNALGKVSFSLKPGSYQVCEVQKSGWTQKVPAGNACHILTLLPGSATQVDFGNCPNSSCPVMASEAGGADAPVAPVTFSVAADDLDSWVEQWLLTPDGPVEETLEPDAGEEGDAGLRVFLPVVVK